MKPRAGRSGRDAAALTLLALLALLVNYVGLGRQSIWLDESTSIGIARRSLGSIILVVTGDGPNMGLYYVLLHFWIRLFGEGEAAVRSLSALCGALAVPAVALVGARLFGRRAGLAAGLLLALNSWMVLHAQLARSYALLVLLVTLSSYCFVVELERPSRAGRIGYVLASALAFYAHYFAALVLVAQLITLLALRRRAALTREWLGMGAAILLLSVPEIIFALRRGPEMLSWIAPPSLGQIPEVLVALAGGSAALLLVLLASGVWAVAGALKEGRAWPHGFVALWLLAPVVLTYVVSLVQPMFLARYLIVCVPALLLFGAAAIERLRRPVAAGGLALLLVAFSSAQLVDFYRRERGEDWRGATRSVLAAARAGDAVLFFPDFARKPFGYYQGQAGVSGPLNLQGRPLEGRERIWLVIRKSDVPLHRAELERLQASLATGYRLAGRRGVRGVGIELYER